MCDADVGLIPMYWVKRHDHPYPDFSTTHKCRDFAAVWDWARDNQVQMGEGWDGAVGEAERGSRVGDAALRLGAVGYG